MALLVITDREDENQSLGRRWLRDRWRSRLHGNDGARRMISHTSKDAKYGANARRWIRTTALTAKDQATLDLMCDLAGDCDKFADKAGP